MELGYTSLDAQSITEHSPLVRVTFTRRLSARSTISLTGAREFSSAAETFQSNLTFFGVAGTLANGRASGEPFRSDYGLVSWTTTGNILDLAVRARLRRETYQTNTTLNARLFGAGVAVNRAISPRLRVGLRADYDRRQFTAQQNDTREQRIGADLALALGPKVSLSFGFDHFSGNVLGGPKYVENRESLRITYRPRTKSAR